MKADFIVNKTENRFYVIMNGNLEAALAYPLDMIEEYKKAHDMSNSTIARMLLKENL